MVYNESSNGIKRHKLQKQFVKISLKIVLSPRLMPFIFAITPCKLLYNASSSPGDFDVSFIVAVESLLNWIKYDDMKYE